MFNLDILWKQYIQRVTFNLITLASLRHLLVPNELVRQVHLWKSQVYLIQTQRVHNVSGRLEHKLPLKTALLFSSSHSTGKLLCQDHSVVPHASLCLSSIVCVQLHSALKI